MKIENWLDYPERLKKIARNEVLTMEECAAIIMKSYRNLKEKRKGLQELLQKFDLEGYCEWKRIWNQQFGGGMELCQISSSKILRNR